MGFVEGLNEDPDHAPKCGADCHGGDEYTSRDFTAVRDDDEEEADDAGDGEGEDYTPAVVWAINLRISTFTVSLRRNEGK